MKNLMITVLASLCLMAGCNERKAEAAPESKPVAEAPAAPAASAAVKAPAPKVNFKSVDWEEAMKMNAAGAIYVDVRTPQELSSGFAPYALNIPLNDLKTRFNELPKDKDLLIYCRSGRRSEAAAHFLVKNGYERVYNVLGGFLAYPREKK